MDLEYINLMIGLVALLSSFVGHVRHSKCCYGLIDIDMKNTKNTPPETPINNYQESSALLKESDPIPIPKKPIIKNWL
jgi:hypothetical protein